MKLFLIKAWRDLKNKKIRSIPIILVVIIGGIASIMYANVYISWIETKQETWQENRYHHLKVTFDPMDLSNITRIVDQAKTRTGLDPYFEIRTFIEVEVQVAGGSNVTAHLYAVNGSDELQVDRLYYYPGNLDTLPGSSDPNVVVADKFTADRNDWKIGTVLTVYPSELDPFNLTTIALVDSPEYMLMPGAASEFFKFWEGPVIWMRMTDLLQNTGNEVQPNQIVFYFKDPSEKNRFLEELYSADLLGIGNVIPEGRHFYFETMEIEMLGMSVVCMVVFAGIAAVMLYIVLKRIIEEELAILGLFKSLGFTNREIITSTVIYSSIISLFGGFIGALVGTAVGIGFRSMFYEMTGIKKPPTVAPLSPLVLLPTVAYLLFILLLTTIGSILACRKIFKMSPVEAIRPKAKWEPGKISIVERLAIKLRKLSPLMKFSFRSLFQEKRKAAFILIGIFLATFISLFGSTIGTSWETSVNKQFNYYQQWDVQVIFKSFQNPDQVIAMLQENGLTYIEYEPVVMATIRVGEDLINRYPVTGLWLNTTMRQFDEEFAPGRGEVVLSRDLVRKFNTAKNEEITITDMTDTVQTVRVIGTSNELSGKGIFCSIETALDLAGIEDQGVMNGLYMKTTNADQIKISLANNPAVREVIVKQELEDSLSLVSSLTVALIGGALFAAMLVGVAITVTIVSISISERKHDFVNFRALGVSNMEIFNTVLLELVITGIGGILLGFITSIWLMEELFGFVAAVGFNLIFELTPFNILLTIGNVLFGIVLATYLSLRSLFRTSISEETVSRILG
ncbi:MAG: ABC transporter permease [Candidatus Odinarchaeota archaeon]